jgi:hypothetical protein
VRETAGFIIRKDPTAVVIVMGDHGTHLFRRDWRAIRNQVFSNIATLPIETLLEDQHVVTYAVYPASFCQHRMSEPLSTITLMPNLIACLSGDDSPTDEERRRTRSILFLGDLWDLRDLRSQTATQKD